MNTSALRPAVPLLVLIIAGCIIAAIGNGVRTSFGLFTLPMTADLGLSREQWGMAMAIQNLAWGIADRLPLRHHAAKQQSGMAASPALMT